MKSLEAHYYYDQGYSANRDMTHRLIDNPYTGENYEIEKHKLWAEGWFAYSEVFMKEFTE